jgi:hypothetical protein
MKRHEQTRVDDAVRPWRRFCSVTSLSRPLASLQILGHSPLRPKGATSRLVRLVGSDAPRATYLVICLACRAFESPESSESASGAARPLVIDFARGCGPRLGSGCSRRRCRRACASSGTSARTPIGGGSVVCMASEARPGVLDRVVERRRAVALARHYREAEGLSIRQIADRLSRSPATVKAYFYDPTSEKSRAVKARCQGVCRRCGAYTQPRNGKGDAYAYFKTCHAGAIERRWTRERVVAAMRGWHGRHGRLPSSYDWSRTHARRRGGEALARLDEGRWPAASVVTKLFGDRPAARRAAAQRAGDPAEHQRNTVANYARNLRE